MALAGSVHAKAIALIKLAIEMTTAASCVAASYMVHEAQKALALLNEQGITATLVDLYSLPCDEAAILGLVQGNQGQVLTVEDNHGAGIGAAVAEMLAARCVALRLGYCPDRCQEAGRRRALASETLRRDTYERTRLQGRL